MSTIEDRPTTGERYSSAVESSNLRLGERRGDADYIIAAGLVPNGMASAMYRWQVEYDSGRAEHQAAEKRMRDTETFAKRQKDDKPLSPGEDPTKRNPQTAEQKAAQLLKAASRFTRPKWPRRRANSVTRWKSGPRPCHWG